MTDKSSSHADRLEQALRGLDASKRAAADWAASIEPELERLATLNEQLEALPQSERRQVLDAMGLKHVSAAPKPITPLKGSSYRPLNKPPEPPRIDWRHWRHMPEIRQWEACALSLNINPDNVKHPVDVWMNGQGREPIFTDASFPSKAVQIEFHKRLRQLGDSLFSSGYFTAVNNLVVGGSHLATVNLREFAAWALHVEWEAMPPELVAMAATATTVPVATPAQTAVTPAPVMAGVAEDDVQPDKAGPMPVEQGLLTKDIAVCFGDCYYSADNWPKRLSGTAWLKTACIGRGEIGGASAIWNPLTLAQLMHHRTKGDKAKEKLMNTLNSRFTRNPALGLWRDTFNEYFATYCTTD